MNVSKIAASLALMSMATPALALAAPGTEAPVARVAAASGEVFIARDGKLLPATAGQTLNKGDRVVTRANARAQVAMNACSVSLAASSMLSVSDSCATAKTLNASAVAPQGANAMHGSTAIVAILALAAIIGGIIIATKGKGHPTSP